MDTLYGQFPALFASALGSACAVGTAAGPTARNTAATRHDAARKKYIAVQIRRWSGGSPDAAL
ncbi:hypothetical protein BZL30_7652 [Mycobacterium kansasii]|uniref:Lipoprotein n=1 Tax=Mycobacterium kansasii TaxID=1768 RepID=A0A1V3WKV7_MYCKA|nr:hypothetical protein BZL30_7652 [Mycobacterium kansasii]